MAVFGVKPRHQTCALQLFKPATKKYKGVAICTSRSQTRNIFQLCRYYVGIAIAKTAHETQISQTHTCSAPTEPPCADHDPANVSKYDPCL